MVRAVPQSAQRYPLTSMLGTDVGVRLLRALARHGGQLSAADLARRTALAKASVARGLAALGSSFVVETSGSGRSLLYRLRPDHPLAAPLTSLFEAEEVRFQDIIDSAREAAARAGPGVLALWLFGSTARGEDRSESDLDLAVVAIPECRSRLADGLRGALIAPAERLGFKPSLVALDTDDVVRLAASRDPWWLSVANDALVLQGQRPEVLAAALARPGASAQPA